MSTGHGEDREEGEKNRELTPVRAVVSAWSEKSRWRSNSSSATMATGGGESKMASPTEYSGFNSRGSTMKTYTGSPRDTSVRRGKAVGHALHDGVLRRGFGQREISEAEARK